MRAYQKRSLKENIILFVCSSTVCIYVSVALNFHSSHGTTEHDEEKKVNAKPGRYNKHVNSI